MQDILLIITFKFRKTMYTIFAAALLAVSVFASDADYNDTTAWATASPLCGSGQEQSPVDFTGATIDANLVFSYEGYPNLPLTGAQAVYSDDLAEKKVTFDADTSKAATLTLNFGTLE